MNADFFAGFLFGVLVFKLIKWVVIKQRKYPNAIHFQSRWYEFGLKRAKHIEEDKMARVADAPPTR